MISSVLKRRLTKNETGGVVAAAFLLFAVASAGFFFSEKDFSDSLEYSSISSSNSVDPIGVVASGSVIVRKEPIHMPTPEPVKGIYMTSWVAGTKNWRENLVKLIDDTEINSVIIDVKDYSGRISFEIDDPVLKEIGAAENRISDIREFIDYLHQKEIYVIARISVFQDPYLVKKRPDLAVKRKSDGVAWKDYKGLAWLNPASQEVWDYVVRIGKESEKAGFDELNFDYIRYPSDGNMKDIVLHFADGASTKAESIEKFFAHLAKGLAGLKIPISADLFGFVTTHTDDLNIGQVLEGAAPYFDYIAPMVYPSHYPPTYDGFKNPAEHPYEVIYHAMASSTQRLSAAGFAPSKLRPWLQDFDMGANYTADMIRKEKQAVYDAGLTSWMLWDPANKYTRGAID